MTHATKSPGSWCLAVFALGLACILPSAASAQNKGKELDKLTGTVKSIEAKGRTFNCTIEGADGTSTEFLVTARTAVAIRAKGDEGFLRPKGVVSAENLAESNGYLFVTALTVYLGPSPNPQATRNAMNGWDVCGQITALDPKGVALNCGAAGPRTLMFENEVIPSIVVQTSDLSVLEEGDKIEVEGNMRGTKFLPVRISAQLEKELVAEEVLADKKTKAKTAKTNSKTSDKPAAGGADASDPFGLNKKKTDKPEKPADKAADKKGAEKGGTAESPK